MATIMQQQSLIIPEWARNSGRKISLHSRGLSDVLARIAEPFMRYSAIYLVLSTAPVLSFLKWIPAIQLSTALVVAGPEFVLLGAINVAEESIKTGSKFWGWVLAFICACLSAIMIVTFADIFKVLPLDPQALNVLSFARSLVAITFGIVLGKLDAHRDQEDTNVLQVTPTNVVPDLAEIAREVATMIPAQSPTIDYNELASILAPMLTACNNPATTEQHSGNEASNTEPLHIVPKLSQNRPTDNAEVTKKMRRLLQRDSTIGPTELAAKTGASKSYASRFKASFLETKEG